jgi:hypothetical protein
MEKEEEELKKLRSNISEEDLDNIYLFLDLFLKDMSESDVTFWNNILSKIDPEYKSNDD